MTQWLHQNAATDRTAEQPTIHPVVPICSVSGAVPEPNARAVVHDGMLASAGSQAVPIVFIVDDNVSLRRSLEPLICGAGWQPEVFESVQDFLCCERVLVPSCLIVDITLPGLNCLDLQNRLAADRKIIPIIFVTDQADVETTVKAMKAGAFDFFAKPFCDDLLLSAIGQAIERSRSALDNELATRAVQNSYRSLSSRERDVMALVVSGLLNKQVGFELGISEITVKAHRGHVMRKMKASSFASLVRMAMRLGLSSQA